MLFRSRDVKPENILVDRHDHPRLVDFDLSVRIGDPASVRVLAGTVAYLSPEQTRAEAVTPASDLYAVGVILYWGLRGELPFNGSVSQVIEAHRHTPPPDLADAQEALAPYAPMVQRALAKRPEERYRDARTFREDLLALLHA